MQPTVLIVDDDVSLLDSLQRSLHQAPYRILTESDPLRALEIIGREGVAVLVTDELMPGLTGVELLTSVREHFPRVVGVMLSGQATVAGLVHAINDGWLFRFLIKPCRAQEVDRCIRHALAQFLVLEQCRRLVPQVRHQTRMLDFIREYHPEVMAAAQAKICPSIQAEDAGIEEATDQLEVTLNLMEGGHPRQGGG